MRLLLATSALVLTAAPAAAQTTSASPPLERALLAAATLTVAFVVLLAALEKAAARLKGWIASGALPMPELRLQGAVLVERERLRDAASATVSAVRSLASLAVAYLYISAVFSRFAATRGLTARLLGYALAPVAAIATALLHYVPNLIFIAVTVFVVRWALALVELVFDEIETGRIRFPGFYPEWAEPTWQIARVLIVAFTVVALFPYLPGSGSPAFKGVSVFLGVLLSLGSGSAISNAVSGTIMTYMRPFRVGDRVRIADTVGDVVERSLLVTRVRTIKNEEVTIPNSLILSSHIVNYSAAPAGGGLILHTAVTIGYDAPWRKVHALLVDAARSVDGVLAEPAPFVLQTDLGDFSVRYELNAYTDRPHDMTRTYSALHAAVQDSFAAAGVEIMSPHFFVRRTGPESTVPPPPPPAGVVR